MWQRLIGREVLFSLMWHSLIGWNTMSAIRQTVRHPITANKYSILSIFRHEFNRALRFI
ncbi:hypothetical protein Syun_001788 [Stephania yunnanensis]|uniref:Uncharacterized protein n=1 Tax=Stephania yunnanensis TaxID=152371 RepID=A0AAP0LEF5_9MAGN